MKSVVKDYHREALQNHVLEEIEPGGKVRNFWMRTPNKSSIYAVGLTFAPWGITIGGDISIGPLPHGITSCPGYDLEWFSGHKSEDYLCVKFFGGHKEWSREDCLNRLAEWAAEDWSDNSDGLAALQELIDDRDAEWPAYETEQDIHEYLCEHKLDWGDGLPGYDYPRDGAGWLCAIQQRFRELFQQIERGK